MVADKMEERIVEDAPFEIPPFDEKEFIRKELISFKTTVVLFVFSLVTAGITYALWRADILNFFSYLLIALGLAGVALRFLFKAAKIDISHWKRKEWTGTMFLYFFFWLGFFLLMSNPPITDAAAPAVTVHASPLWQAPGQAVEIGAYVADNADLIEDSLSFRIEGPGLDGPWPDLTKDPDDPFWTSRITLATAGTYQWTVSGRDAAGLTNVTRGEFHIGDPFAVVETPRSNAATGQPTFEVSTDQFRVLPQDGLEIFTVQYSLDGAQTWHNFSKDAAKAGWWTTDPSYEGWTKGSHQVWVRALSEPSYFAHGDSVGLVEVVDPSGPYNMTVAESLQIVGTQEAADLHPRAYQDPKKTPGLDALGVGLAVVTGLVLVGRRHARA